MGNNNSNDYNIEKFVSEINLKDVHNISDSEIKSKLENLLKNFEAVPNYFEKFKKEEEKMLMDSLNYKKRNKGENEYYFSEDSVEEIEITEDDPKFKRFLYLISFMIKLNFQKDYLENYNYIIQIMSHVIKQKEFFRFFMKNSTETLTDKISNISFQVPKKFYQISTKLLIDLFELILEDPMIVLNGLNTLRKIMIVPKKLSDPAFAKDEEIKLNLIRIMKYNMIFLKNLFEYCKKEKSSIKNKEIIEFVRNTLTEFYSNALFSKLSEELTKKENSVEIQKTIVETFNLMSQIDFVISDQFLRCEKEVRNIANLIDNTSENIIIEESIKFLIYFHLGSFNQESFVNFSLFIYQDSDLEDKLFAIFQKSDTSEDIKFLICCLFMTISIIEQIWLKLRSLNMIKPTIRFLNYYLCKTYETSNFKETEEYTKNRISKISTFVKVLSIITEDQNYKKIYHVEFFKFYFDAVQILFKVNHISSRFEILHITNVFTYFYDCKKKMLDDKNSVLIEDIHSRLEDLYNNLKKYYNSYVECYENKNIFQRKKENETLLEYKNKYAENIKLLDELCSSTKTVFFRTCHEFGLLMSILVNLMLNHDYKGYLHKVIGKNKNFFKEPRECVTEKNSLNISKASSVNGYNNQHGTEFNTITGVVNEHFLNFDETRGGTLVKYEDFFNHLSLFKNDFKSYSGPHSYVMRYIYQITLARLINNPIGNLEIEKQKIDNESNNENDKMALDLNNLYEMMKNYSNDSDILHKIIYSINRSVQKVRKIRNSLNIIKKILDEVKVNLFKSFNSSIIVNRECLRLLCTCTMYSENTLMWLKFDSKKVHVDFANHADVVLQYKDRETEWEPYDEEKERIIFTPHLKVKSYADKMGVIFYGDHHLVLPKRLHLGDNFSIWFRFFNPIINTNRWHVLLQDPSGLGGLIVIDSSRRRLGCFTEDGVFIDSGIDLNEAEYKKKWIQVALCFRSREESEQSLQSRLDWYINGIAKRSYMNEKILIPKYVQYVGNSRDFNEPFGVFCDLRIYRNFLFANNISFIYHGEETKRSEKSEYDLLSHIYSKILDSIIYNFLSSPDTSEETFYFTIKFLNNMMANRAYRNKFINYNLIIKINNFLNSRITETKKDVAKFLQTIS